MVVALLSESDMKLSEEVIETILDKVERLSFLVLFQIFTLLNEYHHYLIK